MLTIHETQENQSSTVQGQVKTELKHDSTQNIANSTLPTVLAQ